jgi:hypothetical protein
VKRDRLLPADPVQFIQNCIRRRLLWTYHVNVRLVGRFLPRESILAAAATFELVEAYQDDKYLPSYLAFSGGLARTHSTCCSRWMWKVIMSGWSRPTARILPSGRTT